MKYYVQIGLIFSLFIFVLQLNIPEIWGYMLLHPQKRPTSYVQFFSTDINTYTLTSILISDHTLDKVGAA